MFAKKLAEPTNHDNYKNIITSGKKGEPVFCFIGHQLHFPKYSSPFSECGAKASSAFSFLLWPGLLLLI